MNLVSPGPGRIVADGGDSLAPPRPAVGDRQLSAVAASDQLVVGRREALRWRAGTVTPSVDAVLGECPVALCYNGISQAVMMATPTDLEDFALGFSLTEGLLASADQLYAIDIQGHELGIEVSMTIAAQAFAGLKQRRRQLAGRSGCGLCGIESLAQLAPRLPGAVENGTVIEHRAIQRALAALPARQSLQVQTGAAHAAAWCEPDGTIGCLREDVGRHNALDKLIGAHYRAGDGRSGFAVVTSRASYEMVLKAASARLPILVAVSAPTTLAIDYARATQITLAGFARSGRHEVYSAPWRIA